MARIAYVDHSFHKKTQSTAFLVEVLRRHGHDVDVFWDEAWQGGSPLHWSELGSYDVVIMFQALCPVQSKYYRDLHPNVIYIPMLDQFGLWAGPVLNLQDFWEQFQGSKILNFSIALHAMTITSGIASHLARYYQAPKSNSAHFDRGMHGFFWLRRELEVPWSVVRTLISDTRFDSFHIHLAVDPGTPAPKLPSAAEMIQHNVTTSVWYENKAELELVLHKANVFFAPRLGEGIGQSFLEAFSRGQCVVAPNNGTMNEYIITGLNGLLYDASNPTPLDFTSAAELGRRGKKAATIGRLAWNRGEKELVDFILKPSEIFYVGKYQHRSLVRAQSPAPLPRSRILFHGLRQASRQYKIFRYTRPIWHPVTILAIKAIRRLKYLSGSSR